MEIVLGVVANVLKLADDVVRAESDRARGQRRHARYNCWPMLLQQLFRYLKYIPLSQLTLLSLFNKYFFAGRSQLHIWTRSEKRISPNLLATLDRFQKKRVLFAARNRQKGRDRRQQVRHHGLHHRHQRGQAREAGEFFVVRTNHRVTAPAEISSPQRRRVAEKSKLGLVGCFYRFLCLSESLW